MSNTRVLIVQPMISHYRIPFYELFARQLGDCVTVFYHQDEPGSTGETYGFPTIRGRGWSYAGFTFQWGYWKQVLTRSFPVLIVNFDIHIVSSILLLLLTRLIGVKFIWYGIGFGRSKGLRPVRVALAKLSDGVMVYESGAAMQFQQAGLEPSKIFVAHNTVHVSSPTINMDAESRRRFVFVGTLYQNKRVEDLLTAFSSIQHEIPTDVGVDIVGDGRERNRLEALAMSLGISGRVLFHGQIREESKLREIFSHGLAVVSPGQAGLSVLNSFANGVCFITKVGAISGGEIENIDHGVNGYLYSTQSDLSDIMKELANNPHLAVHLGHQAFQHYVSSRTMACMVRSFQDAVHSVLVGRAKA